MVFLIPVHSVLIWFSLLIFINGMTNFSIESSCIFIQMLIKGTFKINNAFVAIVESTRIFQTSCKNCKRNAVQPRATCNRFSNRRLVIILKYSILVWWASLGIWIWNLVEELVWSWAKMFGNIWLIISLKVPSTNIYLHSARTFVEPIVWNVFFEKNFSFRK